MMVYKPTRKELLDLIESMEASGGDATELRGGLEMLEPEVKRVPQTRRNLRFREEEETMEERLTRRVGYLFPNGIPYEKILDYDCRFTLKELREQCRREGLSVSGDKHELAAKLIAKRPSEGIYIARETTAYDEEKGHSYKEVLAVIDDVGHTTYTYSPSVSVGHIEMINVEPPYRRRGFGSKFVQFVIDDMRSKGITKVSASIISREGAMLLRTQGFSFANDLMERSI